MLLSTVTFLYLLVAVSGLELREVYTTEELKDIEESIKEDAVLNFTQLAVKYEYPAERHTVETEDGYLLTIHRIPFGKACGPSKNKIPVLIQHGLFCSSASFVLMGPGESLGYILADQCYDVWLGNSRGNKYSRNHKSLKISDPKFWEFSWHEMGKYDLPAVIDYILNVTGQPSLHYIGHSQGTTQFFIFASLHPEYSAKIRSAHALSPVAIMKNLKSPLIKILAIFHKPLKTIADLVGLHEFMPSSAFLNLIGKEICQDRFPAFQAICKSVLFLFTGTHPEMLNTTMLPVIIGHTPAGSSILQLTHYAQGTINDGFRQYDHGLLGNLLKYGSASPPDYEVEKISIPIAFYYSDDDWFADVDDIARLGDRIPSLIGKYRVPQKLFSHVDFMWGLKVKSLVYDQVLNILKRF